MIELTLLIPLTIGIVEVVKRATKMGSRYIPLVAVVVGLVLAFLLNVEVLSSTLLPGAVAGLSAVGLWDIAKKSVLNK